MFFTIRKRIMRGQLAKSGKNMFTRAYIPHGGGEH